MLCVVSLKFIPDGVFMRFLLYALIIYLYGFG